MITAPRMTNILMAMAMLCSLFACDKSDNSPKAEKNTYKDQSRKVRASRADGMPHVVMISLSGLRTDRIGAYGAQKSLTPTIDSFAQKAILFKNAYAPESYTLPSVVSLFTGQYPMVHQALYTKPIRKLDEDTRTLASILAGKGYSSRAIVSGDQVSHMFGIASGFKPYTYVRTVEGSAATRPAWQLSDSSAKIFAQLEKGIKKPLEPLFLYLQFSDLQMPCLPPEPYNVQAASPETRARIEAIYANKEMPRLAVADADVARALYDGTVQYVDEWLDKTLKRLEWQGITAENSVIVITADRGQELFDKHSKYAAGLDGTRSLYNEQIRVPLLISYPSSIDSGRVIEEPVELVDVPATVLEILKVGWGKDAKVDGRSLLPMIDEGKRTKKIVFSGGSHGRGAIIEANWKYIRSNDSLRRNRQGVLSADMPNVMQVTEELYNLKADPTEQHNVASKRPEVIERMRQLLDARLSGEKLPPASRPASAAAKGAF